MSSLQDPEGFERKLLDFLHHELEVPEAELDREAALVTTGLMASMDLVRLASHLERELGIEIPDRDITTENFDSIAKTIAFTERRLSS